MRDGAAPCLLDMQGDIVVAEMIGCPLRRYAAGEGCAFYADPEISGLAAASTKGLQGDVRVARSIRQQGNDTLRKTESPKGSHQLP